MHFVEKEPSQKRLDFDQKLKSNKILRVPGAYILNLVKKQLKLLKNSGSLQFI